MRIVLIPLVVIVGLFTLQVSAQIFVVPNIQTTPQGTLININKGGLSSGNPHVSGDLVCYAYQKATALSTIHYFNLQTMADAVVSNNNMVIDRQCDVSGSAVVFNRASDTSSAIFTFDTANSAAQPLQIAAQANSERDAPNIGDHTIVWVDWGTCPPVASFPIGRLLLMIAVVVQRSISGHLDCQI